MMYFGKLSTAITIPFGPVLDANGAEYTGALVGDVKISKNNGTPAALNGSATLTHKEVGIYELVLTTGDISAVGQATVTLSKTTYLAPPISVIVLPAVVYDSLVGGTDNLEVDITQISGATPAAALRAALGLGAANLDAQLADLPTNAELAARTLLAGDYALATAVTAAALRAALGLAAANLDAQLADLPTNAELAARTLLAGDYASATAVTAAALRAALGLGAANLDAQLADLPTNAELAARTLLAGDYASATAVTAAALRAALGLGVANLDTQLGDLPTNAELSARTLPAAEYATAIALNIVATYIDTEIGTIISAINPLYGMTEAYLSGRRWTSTALSLAPSGGGGGGGSLTTEQDGKLTAIHAATLSSPVTVVTPQPDAETLVVIRGRSHLPNIGHGPLNWTVDTPLDLADPTAVIWLALGVNPKAPDVRVSPSSVVTVTPGARYTVFFPLSAENSIKLRPLRNMPQAFEVQAKLGAASDVPAGGVLVVRDFLEESDPLDP